MKRTKRDILIEFVGGRLLTEREADSIRDLAASFKPRVHLIKSDWPFCEVRGIRNEAAAKVIEALAALGLRFREL